MTDGIVDRQGIYPWFVAEDGGSITGCRPLPALWNVVEYPRSGFPSSWERWAGQA
jgi:hypothetical protein